MYLRFYRRLYTAFVERALASHARHPALLAEELRGDERDVPALSCARRPYRHRHGRKDQGQCQGHSPGTAPANQPEGHGFGRCGHDELCPDGGTRWRFTADRRRIKVEDTSSGDAQPASVAHGRELLGTAASTTGNAVAIPQPEGAVRREGPCAATVEVAPSLQLNPCGCRRSVTCKYTAGHQRGRSSGLSST